jgi:hypothetical protein
LLLRNIEIVLIASPKGAPSGVSAEILRILRCLAKNRASYWMLQDGSERSEEILREYRRKFPSENEFPVVAVHHVRENRDDRTLNIVWVEGNPSNETLGKLCVSLFGATTASCGKSPQAEMDQDGTILKQDLPPNPPAGGSNAEWEPMAGI